EVERLLAGGGEGDGDVVPLAVVVGAGGNEGVDGVVPEQLGADLAVGAEGDGGHRAVGAAAPGGAAGAGLAEDHGGLRAVEPGLEADRLAGGEVEGGRRQAQVVVHAVEGDRGTGVVHQGPGLARFRVGQVDVGRVPAVRAGVVGGRGVDDRLAQAPVEDR